jgi:hypothetical protein
MRRAFTLIEALVAIAIGLALCGTAYAAVRLSTDALTTVTRLSTENGLMRAGMIAALEEIDHWEALDPQTGGGPLRAAGQPFAPRDWTADGLALDQAQHRRETWWVGCGASDDHRRYGRYELIGGRDHPDADRSWHGRFLQRVADGLGYYALIDYAPGNTIWSTVDADGLAPDEFRDAGFGVGRFVAGPCRDHGPRDINRLTEAGGHAISRDWPDVAHRGFAFWNVWGPGWDDVPSPTPDDPRWDLGGMHRKARAEVALLPVAPAHWPASMIHVRRFVASYRPWATATIALTSPITGARMKLFFSATGTTLRGARMNRGLDLGMPSP